jgi:anti-sigma B factor antagonist
MAERAPEPPAVQPEPAAPLLQVSLTPRDGTAVVTLVGELDAAGTGAVRAVVIDAMRAHPQRLIVDLGALRYLDSAGTGWVVSLAEQLRVRRVELAVVAAPGSRSRRVLELSGLAGELDLHPDVAAADADS